MFDRINKKNVMMDRSKREEADDSIFVCCSAIFGEKFGGL